MYLKRAFHEKNLDTTEKDLADASVTFTAGTMDVTEPVNLSRAVLLCNVYNFFFAASKACLFPFLSLFLRLCGLTALQTGLILGAKTLVAFIFAPLWAKCAVFCRKRKLVFMFAIFMMALTYLSLTLVVDKNSHVKCNGKVQIGYQHKNTSVVNTIIQEGESAAKYQPQTTIVPPKTTTTITTNITANKNISDIVGKITPTVRVTLSPTTAKPTIPPLLTSYQMKKAMQMLEDADLDLKKSEVESLNATQIIKIFTQIADNPSLLALFDDDELAFMPQIIRQGKKIPKANSTSKEKDNRKKREVKQKRDINVSSVVAGLKEKFATLKKHVLDSARDHTFMLVIIVILIGEVFGSPVEKLADDYWFDFLEKIDELEKYGKHRIWCSLAYITFPLMVALIVDHTDCLFNINLRPFMLHFYMFGAFLGLTFLLGFFYPIASTTKGKYKSKMRRGLSATCCSCVGVLNMITLLLTGIMFSANYNFLFWVLQDLSAPESVMGMCITIATLSEIPMLFFSEQFIKKLGHAGVICLSLLAIAGRSLFYSYLWSPWVVLPVEVLHGLTHTALWCSVLSNPCFNLNPTTDRTMRSILSSMYFGVGFATGSIVGGAIYDIYGSAILFRSCSVLAVCWLPIFGVLHWCCYRPPATEIRYTQLLQADGQSDDEIQDDWLEKALKNR